MPARRPGSSLPSRFRSSFCFSSHEAGGPPCMPTYYLRHIIVPGYSPSSLETTSRLDRSPEGPFEGPAPQRPPAGSPAILRRATLPVPAPSAHQQLASRHPATRISSVPAPPAGNRRRSAGGRPVPTGRGCVPYDRRGLCRLRCGGLRRIRSTARPTPSSTLRLRGGTGAPPRPSGQARSRRHRRPPTARDHSSAETASPPSAGCQTISPASFSTHSPSAQSCARTGLLLGELGLALDVDAPAGEPGRKPGVLALLADGEGELVVAHDHRRRPGLLVEADLPHPRRGQRGSG